MMKLSTNFSGSRVFGAIALGVSVSQAVIYGAVTNGLHVNPKVVSVIGVLTTAIAWLSRSPFAHTLGLDAGANSPTPNSQQKADVSAETNTPKEG